MLKFSLAAHSKRKVKGLIVVGINLLGIMNVQNFMAINLITVERLRYFSLDQNGGLTDTFTPRATKGDSILVVMMHVITQKQGETNKTDWHALQAVH